MNYWRYLTDGGGGEGEIEGPQGTVKGMRESVSRPTGWVQLCPGIKTPSHHPEATANSPWSEPGQGPCPVINKDQIFNPVLHPTFLINYYLLMECLKAILMDKEPSVLGAVQIQLS